MIWLLFLQAQGCRAASLEIPGVDLIGRG